MPQAKVGQVWQDTYNYKSGPFAQNPPTLTVTEVGETWVKGTRTPSGRKTSVALDSGGRVRGYRLLRDVAEPSP